MGNSLGINELLNMYSMMVKIRYFEEKVLQVYEDGKIFGFIHLCIGQEGVAVGICSALKKDDYVVGTHRSHGHAIAKGLNPNKMMAEIFGKVTGYCRGKAGSMHIVDITQGFMGANGIVGGGIPIATGLGLAIKKKKEDKVVVCFFGDGAANQGTFHESLNIASLWKLPIVYVCENNLYAYTTHFNKGFPIKNIAERAGAYGMEGIVVDGMDILAVRKVADECIGHIKNGSGPYLVECKTYRFRGHSRDDGSEYRTREEIEEWKQKDPIVRLKEYLLKDNLVTKAKIECIEKDIEQLVNEAVDFASNSPIPELDELERDVHVRLKEDYEQIINV